MILVTNTLNLRMKISTNSEAKFVKNMETLIYLEMLIACKEHYRVVILYTYKN